MSNKLDYYEVLGIEKNADETAIKKAIKKKALKYHPDMPGGKSEEGQKIFLEVQEAQTVLSNPKLKNIYDSYGHEGLEREKSGKTQEPSFNFTSDTSTEPHEKQDTADFFNERATGGKLNLETSLVKEDGLSPAARAQLKRENSRRKRKGLSLLIIVEGKMVEESEVSTKQPPAEPIKTTKPEPVASSPAKETPTPVEDVTETSVSVEFSIETMKKAGEDVDLPLEKLEKFRDNLKEMTALVEKAITVQRKKKDGPRP